jgi:hypothetical protein
VSLLQRNRNDEAVTQGGVRGNRLEHPAVPLWDDGVLHEELSERGPLLHELRGAGGEVREAVLQVIVAAL